MRTKRIMGLIVLGCVLANFPVLAGLIAWLGTASGIVVGLGIAAVVIGTYVVVVGPWQRRWGATDEEVRRRMPGDDLLRSGTPSTTRAITITDARGTSGQHRVVSHTIDLVFPAQESIVADRSGGPWS